MHIVATLQLSCRKAQGHSIIPSPLREGVRVRVKFLLETLYSGAR